MSQWAAKLEAPTYKAFEQDGKELIEFAAPVEIEGEILGFIRYGFNTATMKEALEEVLANGKRERNRILGILFLLGLFSLLISYFVVRRMACAITRKPVSA